MLDLNKIRKYQTIIKCKNCKEPMIYLLRKDISNIRQCVSCGIYMEIAYGIGGFEVK